MRILLYLVCSTGAVVGVLFASQGDPFGLRVHGWLLLFFSLFGILFYAGRRTVIDFDEHDIYLGKFGILSCIFWGGLASLLQVVILLPLLQPLGFDFSFFTGYFSYGRLYPSFIAAMLYGFGGNLLLLSGFYILRRTCEIPLFPRSLSYFVFWGYQLFLLFAVSGSVLGISQGRLYAESEWYADILLFFVLLGLFIVYVGTLLRRRHLRIYVANWFYLSFILGFLFLHVLNSLSLPVSFLGARSYSLFSGVEDAIFQSLYFYNMGHFFLPAGFLGAWYYFLPRLVGRPIFSYRLSALHFYSFVLFSLWGFSVLFFYTSFPDWFQNLGMIFIILLAVPSFGGAVNGFLTLSNRGYLFWQSPLVCMMVFGLLFYILSIFVSILIGLRSLTFLGDIFGGIFGTYFGHLGWGGLFGFAFLYYLFPYLFGYRHIYSQRLIYWHLVLLLLSMILYFSSSLLHGGFSSYMLGSYDIFGFLSYRHDEVILATMPFYLFYFASGILYFLGYLLMLYNFYRTVTLEDDYEI